MSCLIIRCSAQRVATVKVVAQRSSISPVSRPSVVRQVRPSPSSSQPATPAKAKSPGPLSGLFSQVEDPLLRIALQEPVAFFGGLVVGALRLNLTEDPLKGWVDRTAELAGLQAKVGKADNLPSQ
ncbi:MAG: hypothetical protein WDW36_004636 [Sanguina aurantia]